MAVCNKRITQFYLPPTHKPYLPLLPSRKASLPFGRYQLVLLGEQRHIGARNMPRVFVPWHGAAWVRRLAVCRVLVVSQVVSPHQAAAVTPRRLPVMPNTKLYQMSSQRSPRNDQRPCPARLGCEESARHRMSGSDSLWTPARCWTATGPTSAQ